MSNTSVLDQNIMHALDDDNAVSMFLRLRDRFPSEVAEHKAYEWRKVSRFLDSVLPSAFGSYGVDKSSDIKTFIADRFFYRSIA